MLVVMTVKSFGITSRVPTVLGKFSSRFQALEFLENGFGPSKS
jgi:hypothetical protein